MELPVELSKAPPRDIDYNHELFSKTRKKIKAIFIGAFFFIPLTAVLFLWKFNDVVTGVIWGAAMATLFELIAVGMMVNAKKSVELFRNGIATLGTVDSIHIPRDKQGNTYYRMQISYSDKLGIRYNGKVGMVGKAYEVDKKAGDQITVLYFEDKPQTFAVYTPDMGITMSRSKQVN